VAGVWERVSEVSVEQWPGKVLSAVVTSQALGSNQCQWSPSAQPFHWFIQWHPPCPFHHQLALPELSLRVSPPVLGVVLVHRDRQRGLSTPPSWSGVTVTPPPLTDGVGEGGCHRALSLDRSITAPASDSSTSTTPAASPSVVDPSTGWRSTASNRGTLCCISSVGSISVGIHRVTQ
jgi:hypothetical protein